MEDFVEKLNITSPTAGANKVNSQPSHLTLPDHDFIEHHASPSQPAEPTADPTTSASLTVRAVAAAEIITEENILSMLEVGAGMWDRNAVVGALTAYNNVDRALEVLCSDFVEKLNITSPAGANKVDSQPSHPTLPDHDSVEASPSQPAEPTADPTTSASLTVRAVAAAEIITEENILSMLEVGAGMWDRNAVVGALTAYNNVDRALEVLCSDFVEKLNITSPAGANKVDSQPSHPTLPDHDSVEASPSQPAEPTADPTTSASLTVRAVAAAEIITEENILSMLEVGAGMWDRNAVVGALTAYNNVDRALEVLSSNNGLASVLPGTEVRKNKRRRGRAMPELSYVFPTSPKDYPKRIVARSFKDNMEGGRTQCSLVDARPAMEDDELGESIEKELEIVTLKMKLLVASQQPSASSLRKFARQQSHLVRALNTCRLFEEEEEIEPPPEEAQEDAQPQQEDGQQQ